MNHGHTAHQLTYPGTKISTLEEIFAFAECADPDLRIKWNIESKINAEHAERTRSVADFVKHQHKIFVNSPYRHSITASISADTEFAD